MTTTSEPSLPPLFLPVILAALHFLKYTCALTLKAIAATAPLAWIMYPHSFRPLLKCHLIRVVLLIALSKIAPPSFALLILLYFLDRIYDCMIYMYVLPVSLH